MLAPCLDFAAYAGCYLLLAGAVSTNEIVAAILCASLATSFSILLRRGAQRRYRMRAVPWLRVIARPVGALLPDALRVGTMLLRAAWRGPYAAAGAWMWQDFRHGGDGDDDATRRAIVTLGISFAPNSYALQLPDARDAILLHRLSPRAQSEDREWPL